MLGRLHSVHRGSCGATPGKAHVLALCQAAFSRLCAGVAFVLQLQVEVHAELPGFATGAGLFSVS